MAEGGAPMSAFAVYSQTGKNTENASASKEAKKEHVISTKILGKKVKKNSKAKKKRNKRKAMLLAKEETMKSAVQITKSKMNLRSKKAKLPKTAETVKLIEKINHNTENSTQKVELSQKVKKKKLQENVKEQLKTQPKKNKSQHNKLKNKQKQKSSNKIKEVTKKENPESSAVNISDFPFNDKVVDEGPNESPSNMSESVFEWLIYPLKIDDFFQNNWEKTPVHIKRSGPGYYKFLMSTPTLDKILRESHILFSKNIDITSYENGVRETHNPPGRAVPSVVWDYYLNGCSVRMLNPQTYIPKLHLLNATLQEFFGCFVGANSYLTPPNSQGFAPHYDDIEAFILQIEGKKRWRLYKPRNQNEYLPRYSSINFDQSEIGEPILDTIVNAGDLLYFPRGTIHQGETLDGTHSLHITLSVYQRNSWGDFLEKLLPNALNRAIENDSEFREGLPIDYLRYSGFVHSANQSDARQSFAEKVKSLCSRLINYIDIDKAADLMGKSHTHDFLPPVLSEEEKYCSVANDGEQMTANGVVESRVEIEPETKVRLLRSHCIRLVDENYAFRIYYSSENSKEYHEYEPQFLEVAKEFVPAVREIILRYPEYVRVEDLPIDGVDNKIQIVKDLWEKCLVVTDGQLCVLE